MSTVRFLFDEHVPAALIDALEQEDPTIEVVCVGEKLGPPKRTPDPELLKLAETEKFALVTHDKRTMQTHVADHLAAGRHTWGVFILKPEYPLKEIKESLLIIWSASQAEEWQDIMEWLPFTKG